jgi:phospholipase/carboxylesterase
MRTIFFALFFSIFCLHSQNISTDLVYVVNKPLKKTAHPPVLIMLHGFGSNEQDIVAMAKSFDERLLTFSLRAPFQVPNSGFCWFRLDFLPNKKFAYDYNQAVQSREKILSFIRQACRAYNADSTKVFLMGYSQGAMMAYDIALSNPDKIKGVIIMNGLLMSNTSALKMDDKKIANLKFFIAHGTIDNVIDFKDGQSAAEFVKAKKAQVTFKSYEMPHAIIGQELKDIQSWIKSNLTEEKKSQPEKK